jgi:hypothetical protein
MACAFLASPRTRLIPHCDENQACLGNAGLRLLRGSPLCIGYVVPQIDQIDGSSEPP